MKKFNVKTLVNNILNAYYQCNETDMKYKDFYHEARATARELSKKYHVGIMQVAGIMAALSPSTKWEQNIKDTESFLKGKRSGLTTYGQFIKKAEAILYCNDEMTIYDILYGKIGFKTSRFFLNIIGRSDVVTIDRHAYRIALNDNGAGKVRMTANQYKVFEDAYLLAARQIGIESTELQAITWHWFKRVNDRGNYLESESECPF